MNTTQKNWLFGGIGVAIVGLIVWGLIALFTPNPCENPPTCKFQKGDEVQIKSSRWGKKGSVVDVWVSSDCDCTYEVSQSTWIEGKRNRNFTEYELEEKSSIDLEDGVKIFKTIFD